MNGCPVRPDFTNRLKNDQYKPFAMMRLPPPPPPTYRRVIQGFYVDAVLPSGAVFLYAATDKTGIPTFYYEVKEYNKLPE